jgi:hypothetical protein
MFVIKIGNAMFKNGFKAFPVALIYFFIVYSFLIVMHLELMPSHGFSQVIVVADNDTQSNLFKLLNESSPIPINREQILTDEIANLGADIDSIKNASNVGDFEAVFNKTIEVVTGPNWGNISAALLIRGEIAPLNNFVTTLEILNILSKNTTQPTQAVNESIIRESHELVTDYGGVLDALAVPIYDVPKMITNIAIPAIIVTMIILAIPRIRKKYKIRY